jgi:hypothetical protein
MEPIAELLRDMERKRLVHQQILNIEKARLEQLKRAPKAGANLMILVLVRVIGIGIETADMLVKEILSRNLRDRAPWPAMRASRAHLTKAARDVGRKGSPDPAMLGCDAG